MFGDCCRDFYDVCPNIQSPPSFTYNHGHVSCLQVPMETQANKVRTFKPGLLSSSNNIRLYFSSGFYGQSTSLFSQIDDMQIYRIYFSILIGAHIFDLLKYMSSTTTSLFLIIYEWHSSFAPYFGSGAQECRSKECRSLTHCLRPNMTYFWIKVLLLRPTFQLSYYCYGHTIMTLSAKYIFSN